MGQLTLACNVVAQTDGHMICQHASFHSIRTNTILFLTSSVDVPWHKSPPPPPPPNMKIISGISIRIGKHEQAALMFLSWVLLVAQRTMAQGWYWLQLSHTLRLNCYALVTPFPAFDCHTSDNVQEHTECARTHWPTGKAGSISNLASKSTFCTFPLFGWLHWSTTSLSLRADVLIGSVVSCENPALFLTNFIISQMPLTPQLKSSSGEIYFNPILLFAKMYSLLLAENESYDSSMKNKNPKMATMWSHWGPLRRCGCTTAADNQ